MTIQVASGTSMPTSTRVVATSSRISPTRSPVQTLALGRRQTAVHQGARQLAEEFADTAPEVGQRGRRDLRALLDEREDDVGSRPPPQLGAQATVDLAAGGRREHFGRHRGAAGRQLVEERKLEVAVSGERERARDRRRGHHQHVGPFPFLLQ
jgi:hypothetical protein